MLSALKSLVPGAAHWPRFVRNRSEQFEGRFGLVEVLPSPSLFFAGMAGSVLPIAIAHGEGRAEFGDDDARRGCLESGLVSLRYVDNHGRAAESYPANPNGSPGGHHRAHELRRTGDDPDAAPGTRVPCRAELLAPVGLGRGQRLDAVVPQRARLGRLSRARVSLRADPRHGRSG